MMATPKVFSLFKTQNYEENFPNVSILGKKVDFFLECSTYDVILPVKTKKESKLDIFEEAVLKLIAYKSLSVRETADILCLPPDLINFIIIRLQDMELIQENSICLTQLGKEYINVDAKLIDNSNIEYEQVKLFVLSQTGDILPYIQKGEFITEPVEDVQGSLLTLEYGTVGNPIRIKGKVLRQDRKVKKKSILQSSSIRTAINRYNRIVGENVKYDKIEYAAEWAIDNTLSDNVCFHMQAVIQNGNIDEILVSDGLVMNVDFINSYIKKFFPDFILTVKERATKNLIKKDESINDDTITMQSIKYRELRKLMNKIDSFYYLYIHECEEDSVNQDQNQIFQVEQKKFLLNCYSAFEWCLFYYNLMKPLTKQIYSVIENQSVYQNKKTIVQMAQKIGVYDPEKYEVLFNSLDSKRINRMYKESTPELRVALSIAIISAANDENSNFRKLLRIQPGMFRTLRNMFNEHGDLSHQTLTYEINKSRNKQIYDLLIDFINVLIPDYEFENNTKCKKENNSISQERLNAEVSLSKKLGTIYYYNILPESIKNEWMLVSPDKVKYPEAGEYFDILYRIMQDTLYYALKDIRKNPQLSKQQIIKKLNNLGIKSRSFETVNDVFVNKILMNENATLGANAMVYLYYQEYNTVKKLVKNGFVELVEKLVQFRKHGNNITLNIDITTLNKIRDSLLENAKIIGGV